MTRRTDTADTPIRRRPDGSIDTAHYMARGREARADEARRLWQGSDPESVESGPGWPLWPAMCSAR